MQSGLKLSVSGVRGVVGETFTPQIVATFARAFGTYLKGGTVLVGRDTRPSGYMAECALVAGLQSVGCRPLLAGILPTPTLLLMTRSMNLRGGIAITASHNAAEWNALKFIGPQGLFLDASHCEALFDVYHQRIFPSTAEQDLHPVRHLDAPERVHFQRVESYVDAGAIRARRFRVAVDCCNGVGALFSPSFLRDRFHCDLVALHDRPDGHFERPPEPLPANLDALRRAVVDNGCDIGFAQDPDGDRLAVVDERGEPIGEALTVGLALSQVLRRHGSGTVVVNQSMSKAVQQRLEALGARVLLSPTGEINVSQLMLERGAVAGGEHSGGAIIPAIHPCRDSYSAMAVILELLRSTGRTVSELVAEFPRYATRKENLSVQGGASAVALRAVRHRYEGHPMMLNDGVHVDFGDRWVQVRRSNTEPVVRIFAEAPDAAGAEALAAEVRSIVEQAAG